LYSTSKFEALGLGVVTSKSHHSDQFENVFSERVKTVYDTLRRASRCDRTLNLFESDVFTMAKPGAAATTTMRQRPHKLLK
jgi:hypothetical protein